jgi:hypothetical protein
MLVEKPFILDASPEKIMQSMRDPVLIDMSEKAREALDVTVTDILLDESTHEFEILAINHARTIKGIDKTKTEENRVRVIWDIPNIKGTWVWSGAHGKLVSISGGYETKKSGKQTELRMFVDIGVSIPVVGKMVAKKIQAGFIAEWPSYFALVEQHAKTL